VRAIPIDQAGLIGCCLHDIEQALPSAIACPTDETVVAGLPRPVARCNVTQGRTGSYTPQDPIDHIPMLNLGMAMVGLGGK
jgi:hypothetical protein